MYDTRPVGEDPPASVFQAVPEPSAPEISEPQATPELSGTPRAANIPRAFTRHSAYSASGLL
jgi:hypothetical protein